MKEKPPLPIPPLLVPYIVHRKIYALSHSQFSLIFTIPIAYFIFCFKVHRIQSLSKVAYYLKMAKKIIKKKKVNT